MSQLDLFSWSAPASAVRAPTGRRRDTPPAATQAAPRVGQLVVSDRVPYLERPSRVVAVRLEDLGKGQELVLTLDVDGAEREVYAREVRVHEVPTARSAPCWEWCGRSGPGKHCHPGSRYAERPEVPCLGCGNPVSVCEEYSPAVCSEGCSHLLRHARECASPMMAITLWQPWAHAIAHLGKLVENRTWWPPPEQLGKRIAIHAGKTWDEGSAAELGLSRSDVAFGAVVATARLVRAVKRLDAELEAQGQERWWSGPVGWVFDDVRPLARPVPVRGSQGLWPLPAQARMSGVGTFRTDGGQ